MGRYGEIENAIDNLDNLIRVSIHQWLRASIHSWIEARAWPSGGMGELLLGRGDSKQNANRAKARRHEGRDHSTPGSPRMFKDSGMGLFSFGYEKWIIPLH